MDGQMYWGYLHLLWFSVFYIEYKGGKNPYVFKFKVEL